MIPRYLRVFSKERKVRLALLLIFLVFLPVSVLYLAYLTEFEWWKSGSSQVNDEYDYNTEPNDFASENLYYQLTKTKCPARVGFELKDYWKCLWSTSITAEGLRQHQRIIWNSYISRINRDELDLKNQMLNKSLTKNRTKKSLSRKRRQLPLFPFNQSDPSTYYTYQKMNRILQDTNWAFHPNPYVSGYFAQKLKKCKQQILPGISLQEFLICIRKISFDEVLHPVLRGASFHPTFLPTTFPPFNEEYDQREFALLKMKDKRNKTYDFSLDFTPLDDEEHLENFQGADPYFHDNWSVYRYRYNNMDSKQRQPGWTYRGLYNSKNWHELNLERFYVPLEKFGDIHDTNLYSDFSQTYPGLGEITEGAENLLTPLDYRWTKDSGYNVYTRYLLPLLQSNDISYYKSKGLLDASVTVRPDAIVLQDIIDVINEFKNMSNIPFSIPESANPGALSKPNPLFPDPETAPYAKAYVEFINHFFGIDMGVYKGLKTKLKTTIHDELEIVRLLLRTYAEVVKTQEACLKEMVKDNEHRLESEDAVQQLVEKAIAANETCRSAKDEEEAISNPSPEYKITRKNLLFIYNSYYKRKLARQRYSLLNQPIPFPICQHNDPSPIDIQSQQGRKSSLQDYIFGPAAYRLNRFFMFFPMDASTLLTVGIVDGERLDESSVKLTGGAIRDQNLTFQYMHIRFGDKWNSIGSEHWIDGKGAQMELQMVFTISGSADSLKYWHILARVQSQLFQFRDKLVIILSILVDVLESDDSVKKKIEDDDLNQDPFLFESLAQAAYHFRKIPERFPTYEDPRGYVSKDPVFRFIDFIPRKASKFYTYRGSLSWPPCFGYVIWSVFEQRLYMSKRQFQEFANIPAYGINMNNYAHNNFRRFEDIYVAEEHAPTLDFATVEMLKAHRTVDRHILVGFHDVQEDGSEKDDHAVVGEEFYFVSQDRSGYYGLQPNTLLLVVIILMAFLFTIKPTF